MADPWAFGWTQLLTLCGLAISALFAFKGLRTFDKWRLEQLEQRKIDVALDALSMAYESKYVFEHIRSRLSTSAEWQDMPEIKDESATERMRRGSYYAILKRMEHHRDFFDRAWKLQPKFMAVFGPTSEGIFTLLHKARVAIEGSCETLMWEFKEQPDRRDRDNHDLWVQMRADIWASRGPRAERDKVGRDLDEFVSKIEARCRPVIEHGYKKSS
jgi:hypothetical protein